jgi:hypothetical protein
MKGNYTDANIFTDIKNYRDHWWAPKKVLALLQGKNTVTTLILITKIEFYNKIEIMLCVYIQICFLPSIDNKVFIEVLHR